MRTWTALIVLFLLGCQAPRFGRVLESGGELRDVGMQARKLLVDERAVQAWGVLEVPEGSRMQAAYAGADALARAELLKYARVRILSVMTSVDSNDPARRDAYEHTLEEVSGSLRRAGSTQHAWELVQHPQRRILRVWSRLTLPRSEVEAALRAWSPDPAGETSAPRAR